MYILKYLQNVKMSDRYYNLMPQTPENNKIRLALEKYDLRRNTGEPTYYLKHAVPSGVNRVKVGGSNCGANNMLLDRPTHMKQLVGGSFPMAELDYTPMMARSRGGTNGRVRPPKELVMSGSMARYPQYNMNEEKYVNKQGAGLWEDMNAWGKQNELAVRSIPAHLFDPETKARDAAIHEAYITERNRKRTEARQKAKTGAGYLWEDKAFQKSLGTLGTALTTMNKKGKGYPKKMTKKQMMEMKMNGSGLWEDMNAWGKQNERNAIALYNNPTVQKVINDPVVQQYAKEIGMMALDSMLGKNKKEGKGYSKKKMEMIKLLGGGKSVSEMSQGAAARNANAMRRLDPAARTTDTFNTLRTNVFQPGAAVTGMIPGLQPVAALLGAFDAGLGAYNTKYGKGLKKMTKKQMEKMIMEKQMMEGSGWMEDINAAMGGWRNIGKYTVGERWDKDMKEWQKQAFVDYAVQAGEGTGDRDLKQHRREFESIIQRGRGRYPNTIGEVMEYLRKNHRDTGASL
jgi:hypothetical protein